MLNSSIALALKEILIPVKNNFLSGLSAFSLSLVQTILHISVS